MPTLLQINSSVNTGSIGRIVEHLGEFVLSKGWNSYIAYGRRCNSSTSITVKIGNKLSIGFHGLQSMFFDSHGLGSIIATKSFIKEIRKIRPSLVHLHNIHGYYINYPILFEYLAEKNIPVVWTLHDCWPFTGHCSYFTDIGCLKWETHCHDCLKSKRYPASLFIDNSYRNYRLKKQYFTSLENVTIISVSKWLGDIVGKSFLNKYPMYIINNGIDLKTFLPISDCTKVRKKYKIFKKYMVLGVANIWSNRKGFNDYLSLSSALSDDIVIVLVGLSKNKINLLPKNIIGVERTENVKELAELYSAADIVLNLSYLETFGMTTVEGLACGTPGIVYNCTASPELISPTTGVIVEPGKIEELILAINKVRSNGGEYYKASCRRRAEMFYDNEDRLYNYMQLYEDLIRD